mgnify:CR=1 FL=1
MTKLESNVKKAALAGACRDNLYGDLDGLYATWTGWEGGGRLCDMSDVATGGGGATD